MQAINPEQLGFSPERLKRIDAVMQRNVERGGLGMRVLMDISQSGLAGSVGEFGWDGAFSTHMWIDRKEALYGVLMVQRQPNATCPIAQQFKALTYQALVE